VGELVGRQALLGLLRELDETAARVVSVTGPAGIGKTALVRAHARAQPPTSPWARGVTVKLGGASDRKEVLARLAEALGVAPDASAPERRAAVAAALQSRGDAAFVLDAADEVSATLAELLPQLADQSPRTRFVITTRTPTGTSGERVVDVPPLDPVEASELMVELARRVRGTWPPTARDRADLDELAKRLGGVPLAMEIAARWLDLLAPAEILDRLGRLTEETAERVGGPLYEAVAGAWAQLEPPARETFAQCSVFAGPFAVSAAEAVVRLSSNEGSVVNALRELRGLSLVQALHAPPGVRVAITSPFRRFARAQLERTGEVEATKQRHAEHYAGPRSPLVPRSANENATELTQIRSAAVELRAIVARYEHAAEPELAAHAGRARRLLDRLRPGEASPRDLLVVQRRGLWMRLPDGGVVELAKKRVARRLVLELARARIDRPGEPVDAQDLFERAWGGQRIQTPAARNRLHVALSSLRKQGLRDWLEAHGDGYRLAVALRVELSDEPDPSA